MTTRASFAVALAGLALIGCSPAPIDIATLSHGALSDGLIAHWALDEGSGAATTDGSGNGHNGVLEGQAWSWITGQFGTAVHFSGSDLISVSGFPPATTSYSVTAWVLLAPNELGAPIANLLSTEVLGGGWALFTNQPTGAPAAYNFRYAGNVPQGFEEVSCPGLVANVWTHVAAVLDGSAGRLSLYVGSAPPVTTRVTTSILPGSTFLDIARSTLQQPGLAFPLTGALDDIAIYNRPLAPEEVAQLGKARVPDPN